MKGRRYDRRGAVLAEFCIALVPLLTTFFTFVQVSRIAAARLVVKHGAIVGARAAAVMANKSGNTPDQPKHDQVEEIENGVKEALGPWMGKAAVSDVDVELQDNSSRERPYEMVTVRVRATFECKVPMGFIACGGSKRIIEETASMPHQGAAYKPVYGYPGEEH